MESTDMECIYTTLNELVAEEFKTFQGFLLEPTNLDGQKPIGRALLENKNRMETATVILQTYPNNVDQIMANILGKIHKTVLQKQYEEKAQSKGAGGSEPATSKGATASGKAQSKGAAGSGPEVDFVTKHRGALIQRVSMVAPILDYLIDQGIMKNEAYSNVRAERTSQGKMRELMEILDKHGAKAKRVFYKGLQEHEPCLLEDLDLNV